jgi:predicted transposase YdaD
VLAKSEGNALIFKQMIERWFDPSTGESIMTLAEQFEQQGFQRGIERGVQQGIEQGVQQGIERGVQQGIERGVQQGIERGVQQGIERGVQQGIAQGSYEVSLRLARRLLDSGLPVAQVAKLVELPLSDVESLAERADV